MEQVEHGEEVDKWRVNGDRDLLYNERLDVPNLPELHKAILTEAHKSKFTTHYQIMKKKKVWLFLQLSAYLLEG